MDLDILADYWVDYVRDYLISQATATRTEEGRDRTTARRRHGRTTCCRETHTEMATITYGGDEVSALVFDLGSSTSRIGYSGEDAPKAVFPSWVGHRDAPSGKGPKDATAENAPKRRKSNLIGDTEIFTARPGVDTKLANPIADGGVVQDWDLYEQLLEYSFWKLHSDPSQHPLLLTDPAWSPRENREKLIEMAFETFNSPAFYLGKTPVLSAFAAGKSTALVFDSGATTTSAIPIVDGYILKKGIRRAPIGGNFVSQQALLTVKEKNGIDVLPQYEIKTKTAVEVGQPASYTTHDDRVPASQVGKQFRELGVLRVLDDFKQTVAHVSEYTYDEHKLALRPAKAYEFPNGYNNLYNTERFSIAEVLFNPRDFIIGGNTETLENGNTKRTVDISYPKVNSPNMVDVDSITGADELILQSIAACDIDLRPQLYPNIVVSGGNTLIPGFADRLKEELTLKEPAMKTKIQAAGLNYERKFAPWIGGSILSSLGTFHELWISKQEYDEFGAAGCEKRI